MTKILPIRAFKDNYIWLLIDKTVWVVDPGDALPVKQFLLQNQLQLGGILVTHHHADHTGGIAGLVMEWPDIPVYGGVMSQVPQVTHFLQEGDEVRCGEQLFSVLNIPGHTLDHIAFYNEEMVFCGDTLFSAGCGRVFEGTYPQMYHSLMKLKRLDSATKMYCGHEYTLQNLRFAEQVEPNNTAIHEKILSVTQGLAEGKPSLPSTLADEKKMNPFLRCDELVIKEGVEKHVKHPLATPEEVFQALREWKNQF